MLLALGAACAQAGNTVTTVTLVVTDAQGNVLMTTDSHGNVLARYTYRPYGTQQSGPTHAGPGYTGHVNDPNTGLVYMQQRYYDPAVGRFISPDPVAPTPGNIFNFGRYTYANDNPIRYTDPDGRCAGPICDTMVQNYGGWANAHPKEADKIGGDVGVPAVIVMASATGASEAGGVVTLVRAAVRVAARKVIKAEVTAGAGKARNKPPEPLKEAKGHPHSIIERPGKDGQYTTHYGDGTWKQYRGSGQDHGGIPRPNVKEAGKNVTPDRRVFVDKGRVRPARPDEIPGD